MAESDIFVSNDVAMDVNFGEVFVVDQGVVYKVIASKYLTTATYAVGAYVLHLEKLYRCITAVEEPEEFDSEKWTQVLLANEVQIANANIALKANADDVYDKTAIDNKVSDINAAIALKANSADVYAKTETYNQTEVDNALATKADADTTYSKTEVDDALALKADVATTYNKTEVDNALATKADAATTYTKTEVDTALSTKADSSSVYSKSDTDTLLAAKADVATTYTKTEVDNALANKANSADVYAKTETYSKTEIDTNIYTKTETYNKTEVDGLINNLPTPMQFKGTLGTGGTITTLPTASSENEGYTYKVITDGTYASIPAKVGDMFTSNGTAWVHIPSGDETFTDTWRGIKVNGIEQLTSSIVSGDVDFVNGTNSTVVFDASGNKIKVNVDGYTQSQIDSKLQEKANASDVYNKTETYTKTEVDNIANTKADKSTTYTKTEVDNALDLKADKSDTYTKEEVDDKVDVSDTASGAVASFDDGSGFPFQEIKCTINAIQEGTPWIDSNVIEKEPYNFRKVAGTASRIGNHLFDKLVGGTVAWNQKADGYFTNRSTISVTGHTCVITADGGAAYFGARIRESGNTDFDTIDGHKYFITEGVKDISITNLGGIDVSYGAKNPIGAIVNVKTSGKFSGFFIGTGRTFYINAAKLNGQTTSTSDTFTLYDVNIIDLTAMFGSTIADYIYSLEQATAGSGVNFFRKLFPDSYYAYNAGELMSVKTTAHKMVGKNLLPNLQGERTQYSVFIGQTDGNTYPTHLIGGQTYAISYIASAGSTAVSAYYKENGGVTISISDTGIFTPEKDMDVQMWLYSDQLDLTSVHDFQLEFGSQKTAYEPYTEHNYALDDVELRGLFKLDANNKLYYDGDIYESIGKITRRYGIVDLGSLNWGAGFGGFYSTGISSVVKVPDNVDTEVCLCMGYSFSLDADMSYFIQVVDTYRGWLIFRDSRYTSASDFKSSLNGKYLLYPLATPTTETADPYTNPQEVDANGTEEYIDSRSPAIPVGHETYYADIYDITGFTSCKVSVADGEEVERKSATIAFGQTVYGGYLEFKNGAWVFTGTKTPIDLGSLDYTYDSNLQRFVSDTALPNIGGEIKETNFYKNVICEIYKNDTSTANNTFFVLVGNGCIYIYDDRYTSASDFKTAMSGIKAVYELATPFTLTLTGAQLETLLGENRVSHNCNGDTEVKYFKGIAEGIEEVFKNSNFEDLLDIPDLPDTDGSYRLNLTITDGKPTFTWEEITE